MIDIDDVMKRANAIYSQRQRHESGPRTIQNREVISVAAAFADILNEELGKLKRDDGHRE